MCCSDKVPFKPNYNLILPPRLAKPWRRGTVKQLRMHIGKGFVGRIGS